MWGFFFQFLIFRQNAFSNLFSEKDPGHAVELAVQDFQVPN